VLAVVALSACSAGGGDGSDLLRRAAATAPADSWTFLDRPDAEQLLECVAGLEVVAVSVDLRGAIRMSIGRQGGDDVAMWFEEDSYVRGAALGAPAAQWVRVDREDTRTVRQVEAALGPSLSSWVLAEQPPPAPRAIVDSAIEFADRVEVLAASDPGSTAVRVTIDEDRVDDLAEPQDAAYPMLTFTVTDGELTAVAAHSAAESDSFGFRWEYDPTGPVVDGAPTDWVDASEITITRPDNQGRTCEIGP
jgi:hypothetical protein